MPRCSSHGPLGLEVAKYQLLQERLIGEFPTSDSEFLIDRLEGIADLKEMLPPSFNPPCSIMRLPKA